MNRTAEQVLIRRFVTLRVTRWLPTGLLIPVLVLLLVERGLSLGQIGLAMAAQGVVVFLLELPTGGLADAVGRRPVLIAATAFEILSLLVLLLADTPAVLAVVFLLEGVYRALESGPLDAWFVDEADLLGSSPDVVTGLARGGTAFGLSIAAGALISAGLVQLDPISSVDPLVLPVAVAVLLRGVDLVAIVSLMSESRPRRGSIVASVRSAMPIVASATRTIRASKALTALVAVEFFWGFGMTSFEGLTPPKLAEVTGSTTTAAAMFGPVVTCAFVSTAVGAALLPRISTRIGVARAAIWMHLLQAATVLGMAVSTGVLGVVAFYVLTLGAHGAANPAYQTLLHERADISQRTTVMSAASMMAHPGGALGGIALGLIADEISVSIAMACGALALAATAPLYLPALRSGTPTSAPKMMA